MKTHIELVIQWIASSVEYFVWKPYWRWVIKSLNNCSKQLFRTEHTTNISLNIDINEIGLELPDNVWSLLLQTGPTLSICKWMRKIPVSIYLLISFKWGINTGAHSLITSDSISSCPTAECFNGLIMSLSPSAPFQRLEIVVKKIQ